MDQITIQQFELILEKHLIDLKQHVSALNQDVSSLKQEMAEGFAEFRQEMKSEFHSVREEISGLARMTSRGFEEVGSRLDVVDRVDKLEAGFSQLKQALHV